jgi:diacylglycerol kinase (ATP)
MSVRCGRVHAVILFNPNSGRGVGGRAGAEAVARAIGQLVQRCTLREASAQAAGSLRETLAADGGPALLVALGGDGTLHHALPDVLASGAAVYLLPRGTENLFAREFGMLPASVDRLCRAIRAARFAEVDIAEVTRAEEGPGGERANPARPFALMLSIGPDASVIHRVARARRGPISRWSYAGPAVREALRPALRPVTLEVDGRRVIDGRAGVLIVANARQYAARIDPAHEASMTDGLLDAVFLPTESTLGVLGWAVRARLRRLGRDPRVVRVRGRAFRVHAPDAPSQVDGEAYLERSGTLEVKIAGQRLRVLLG